MDAESLLSGGMEFLEATLKSIGLIPEMRIVPLYCFPRAQVGVMGPVLLSLILKIEHDRAMLYSSFIFVCYGASG